VKRSLNKTGFKALLATQFLGAFNDNAFKIIISLMGVQLIADQTQAASFVSLVGILFVVPFILFSPLAGFLADRFRKRNIIVSMKVFELAIMIIGGFALASQNLILLCVVLFCMAAQSSLFSPSKYGILPEMLDESEISQGNGQVALFTFVAIILGSSLGGRLKDIFSPGLWRVSIVLAAISVVGLLASLYIRKGVAAKPQVRFNINGFKESFITLKAIKKDKPLFLALCGIVYFWFLGVVFQMNILLYAKNILEVTDSQIGLLLAIVSLGIGVGSLLAGKLSGDRIEFGLVPLGALGLSLFSCLLGITTLSYTAAIVILFLLGSSSGFYTVPLNAFFQQRSPKEERGKFLAAANIVNAIGMIAGSGFVWLVGSQFKANPAQTFLVLGIVSIIGTMSILRLLPIAFVRLINWIVIHSLYRIKIEGSKNVPDKGGGLLVCNHVSYLDAAIALASLHRPVRFLMDRRLYSLPIVHQLCKIVKVIPIDHKGGPKDIKRSLETAREAIVNGELVCIFPEGSLTRTGNLLPFKSGFERIMAGFNAPIIPMYLDNIWGSIFSFEGGKYFFKIPKTIPYPLKVIFGKPMAADSKTHQVRLRVAELGADACIDRSHSRKKLHIVFIETVKRKPFKFCMADSTGLKFNYIKALSAMLALKTALFPKERRPQETNEMVGVLLPASSMAAIVNGALLLEGKVPVNLNFTLSKEAFNSCIQQCSMKTIVTSRKFLEKVKLAESREMVFLEDLKEKIGFGNKTKALLASMFLPTFLIKKFFVKGEKSNIDDVATIIFSSGSTGLPKGVMLTHGNIFSNIEGFYQIFDIKPKDVVMGALPFFHSFGFTATMCFPLGIGIGAVFHPNPMDAAVIGKMVHKYKATMLMGTPTFLGTYLRKCTPEQFKSLRFVVAGAEKLNQKLSDAFTEKYSLIPLEGYGATELSPIVSVGYPDYVSEDKRIRQCSYKIGTVGHPLPGVVAKTVDPDTYKVMSPNEEGLLFIKGPNVMKGYLNEPEKTDEVIKDGWYITGDVAVIDNDGFIKITGRLKRFSKIGGEMVPHTTVEAKILEILGATEPICAVTAVRDERKGERLVVLYAGDIDLNWLWQALSESGLPNLWIPKKDSFYRVAEMPLLGTGKLDLKGIEKIAGELAGESGQ